MTSREEIVTAITMQLGVDEDGLAEEELILFDGMENAYIGVAERFEDGGHRHFVVYSYRKMVDILVTRDGMDDTDAMEFLEFNTVGLYAGPGTPAILRDMEDA
jgi:hypothetical protein